MYLSKFEQYYSKLTEFNSLDLKLERIDNAINEVIPEIKGKYIHVAGTNGKGSTSLFIASILEDNGFSTMLFTSPHIHSLTERIQYRLKNISNEDFDNVFDKMEPAVTKYSLTYFETLFLIFMYIVSQKQPDYIVLETGLGGTYDATNCNFIKTKIPVITSMSQDHKQILGDKIETILKDKLGIVKENNPLFIGKNANFIYNIINTYLPETQKYFFMDTYLTESSAIYSEPFNYNYINAHAVCEYILSKKLPVKKYNLPMCRQEWFDRIMLDGAHNPSGMLVLVKYLKSSNIRFGTVIMSSTSDRDIMRLAEIVKPVTDEIIFTLIPDNSRSYSEAAMKKMPYKFCKDPVTAVKNALDNTNSNIMVAGSLYLCAHVRKFLIKTAFNVK